MSFRRAFVFFLIFAATFQYIYIVEAAETTSGSQLQQIEACMARVRGNCSRRMSCQTNNPGALTYTRWQGRFGGIQCGSANNTTCYPQVENGIAAMLTLVRMRMQQNPQCRTILGLLTTCNYTEKSHRDYAAHVASIIGVAPNQTLDPTNGITMACLVAGMAHWEAGGDGVPFNTKQLLDGIAIAYGQKDIPLGDPNFISQFTSSRVDLADYARQGVVVYPGTPGYASPNPARSGVNHDIYSIPATSGASMTSSVEGTSSSSTSGESIGQSYAATILAQPGVAKVGGRVLVSWSSVGMKTSSCIVRSSNGDVVSRGNAGSERFSIPASYGSGGSFSLTLSCESPAGNAVVREANVLLP